MRKRSKDPLTASITSYFMPWARQNLFKKVTSREFVRLNEGTFQKIVIDANGFGGRNSVILTIFSKFIFDDSLGYWDRSGFRICMGKSWDMSTHELADQNMKDIVLNLESSELQKIEPISSMHGLLKLNEKYSSKSLDKVKDEIKRWHEKEDKIMVKVKNNLSRFKINA